MNIILLVATLIILFLVVTWLLKVARATIGMVIAIALLILGLYVMFGIAPGQVWQPVVDTFQAVWRTVTGGR